MTVKTKNKTLSDGVAYEANPAYTREEYTLRNTTGSTVGVTNPMLMPVNITGGKAELAVAGGEAGIDGLLLTSEDIDEVATANDYPGGKRAFLVRGPAIIRKSMLPANDAEDAAFTIADIVTRLAALSPPILCHTEPAETTTQVE